jgi:hypothetical protein
MQHAGTGGGSAAPLVDAGVTTTDADASDSCADAIVCDSFDDAAQLDDAAWDIVMPDCTGTGAIAIDETVAHSGARSVRVDGAGGYCNHVFLAPKLAGALPDPLYGRFFVRFAAPLGASHVTFFAMHDERDDNDLRMGGQSEILMWNRESDDATLPELSPSGIAASVKPRAETWLCVEFELDGAAGELRTWVDGQAIAGLIVEGEPTPDIDSQWKRRSDWHPQAGDARFGWESYGGDAATLWLDDVALGPARVHCPTH